MKNEHEKLVENNAIQTTDTNLVKKTDHVKLKRKYVIIIMLNILLLKNIIKWWQIILQRD